MSNVGVVIDLAAHDIDLICWFTESDIVEVQPQLSSAVAEREDIALLQFRTEPGAQRDGGHPAKIYHGRPADPASHRMLRLQAGRFLFDAGGLLRMRSCFAAKS
jgi:predicted dehydrogenase